MKRFIQKYPIVSYYIFTFVWTWAIVFYIILSGNAKDLNNPSIVFIVGGIISGIAPSLGAFIISGICNGKEGINKLLSLFKKKNSFKFYLLAFSIVPVISILTIVISHLTIKEYALSITVPLIILGIIWPLFSSFGEEFGWRGFILPKLLSKYTVLEAAIILGIIWEVWHLPMHYIAYKDYGMYLIPAFLLIGFFNLILQTITMTYLFVKSKGGLKLMIAYHYTITSTSIIVGGLFKSESLPVYTILETVISLTLFAIVIGVLYFKNGKELNRLKEKM